MRTIHTWKLQLMRTDYAKLCEPDMPYAEFMELLQEVELQACEPRSSLLAKWKSKSSDFIEYVISQLCFL